ncbi:MAG: nucleotide sugar dehydrogenase [Alphaproteobacteria bacterium]|nr:nucleotide sugar dehydrogenase [Alphaproteobacteria bacterium]
MKEKKTIAIIGLGYVGLPLAVAFGKKGYEVIAYDINKKRIEQLKEGIDVTLETTSDELRASPLHFTSEEESLDNASIYIVTVPTPINETNRPDLSMIISATEIVGRHLKKRDIVIYESTVYPGVTEDECVPILEKISGLKYKVDFGVGYSPERINPGDKLHRLETIKKVVSGSDAEILKTVADLYGDIIDAGIFKCASIQTAEAAKVIENIQRDVNIALMNELSLIFDLLGINTHDVLDAASTKWNFSRFEPGLVGGHCIGVDPYYLTHCAEKLGYHPEVILSGRRINDRMGGYVAEKVIKLILNSVAEISFPPVVTILGFTFKENVPDIRNTKVVDTYHALKSFGAQVQIYDPFADVAQVKHEYGVELSSLEKLVPGDAVVIAVKHKPFIDGGWPFIKQFLKTEKSVIVDLKNCLPCADLPKTVPLWRL